MNALLEELKHVSNDRGSNGGDRYTQLIAEITANFDQFNEEDSRDALVMTSAFAYTSPSVEGARQQQQHSDAAFLNYTYQRQPDHRQSITADLFVHRTPGDSNSSNSSSSSITAATEEPSRRGLLTDRFGASVTSLCFSDK